MPANVALIGLDATEPSLFREFIGALGEFRDRTASGTLVGYHDVLTDTVWPEIRTGSGAGATGHYYQVKQIRSGEPTTRPLRADELDPDHFYWNVAARSGRRVLAFDQPLSPALGDGEAVEITEWGTHDRPGFASSPTEARFREIFEAAGRYPVTSCDRDNTGSPEARRRLHAALSSAVPLKTSLIGKLLNTADWDLFSAVLAEGHCGGHHFWPLEPGVDAGLIRSLYGELAEAVDVIYGMLGTGSTVIVYCSHGMAPADYGTRLVPTVLTRMGLTRFANPSRRRLARMVPAQLRSRVGRALGPERVAATGIASRWSLDDPGVSAIPLPNSRQGAIRLSIAGRDPGGSLAEGSAHHAEVIESIIREFSSIVEISTGRPVVRDVIVTDDAFGKGRADDLPDLVVRFRSDGGPIGACRSSTLGILREPVATRRTGEHGTPGAIWAAGPGIAPGSDLGDVRTTDLAPTALSLLDVDIPDWMDGSAIRGITG